MGRRLILDTNVLVDLERGRLPNAVQDDDSIAVAALTVAEYRTGIELADDERRARARSRALDAILSAVEVLDYTERTATHHAQLLAATRRSGRPRSAHDLILAAHAAETGRQLLSRDARARFGDLPGVAASAP